MKWSQKLFLPILIVSAFLLNTASGGVPLPSPNPSQQAEGANTSKHQNPENPKPMQAVGRQSSSRPTAAEPEDYPSSLPIWFQVVTTLTLLGFTGGLWWVSYKQSQIAQKALQIAERAYVNVYEIKILGGKIVPGKFPEIMVGYKNSGRTPAFHLWVSTGMNHASKTIVPEDLPKTGRIDAGEDGWKGPKVGEILPPDVIRYRSATP